MSNNYLEKAVGILENLNIKVKDINSKSEINKSKSFSATFVPSVKKVIIR